MSPLISSSLDTKSSKSQLPLAVQRCMWDRIKLTSPSKDVLTDGNLGVFYVGDPKIYIYMKSLEPANVTLLGKKVSEDVIKFRP